MEISLRCLLSHKGQKCQENNLLKNNNFGCLENDADEINPERAHLIQAHVHCVPTANEWDTASYIFIPTMHLNTWSYYVNATLMVLVMKTSIQAADLSNHSKQLPLCLRQSYISPTNWVTGQPLVWVWIWLIGSWLSQAFIMPNRQLTKATDTVKGFKSKRYEISD